ncbi:MAG TPA: DNA recombination protein RmuC [Candidatus Binataceae bacterium]|nr:DNA recombination protein RmuC [Candidatus Binataceae bacterium]
MAGFALLLGLLAGYLAGWMLSRKGLDRALRDSEAHAAAVSGENSALRSELERRNTENVELRRAIRDAEIAQAATAARSEELQRSVDEQRVSLQYAEKAFTDVLRSLAADALSRNNDQFLALARENLVAVESRAVADLETRQRAIECVVVPVRESLQKMDEQLRALESTRGQAYAALSTQLEFLAQNQSALRTETANLVKALRVPTVRGRWGEIQLRRVVEIAGMLKHCDFLEQSSYDGPEGKLRPDLRVLLPGGKNVIVDAKAPLQAYLDSLEAPTDEIRIARLKDHARQVREHMSRLAAKSYWDYLKPSPEFVVLFLPGETFFSAALEQDPALIEQGVNQRVILATPTTLIALLRAVAYGWRQAQLADNAQRISELGKELYDRLATSAASIGALGAALRNCVEKYNRAAASLESRVLPAARRFKELGVTAKEEIAALEPLDTIPRELTSQLGENGSSTNGN